MLETAVNICVVTDPRLYIGQEIPSNQWRKFLQKFVSKMKQNLLHKNLKIVADQFTKF